MLTEQQVRDVLRQLQDPFLHRTFEETNAIQEIKIKEEKNHVSVKIALSKTGTGEQLQLQTQIVNALRSEERRVGKECRSRRATYAREITTVDDKNNV